MKAKIFIVSTNKEYQKAIKSIEDITKGEHRFVDVVNSWNFATDRRKLALYKSEINRETKFIVFEISKSIPFYNFLKTTEENGEQKNVICVHRPYIKDIEVSVSLFFISWGYPEDIAMTSASYRARFDVIDLRTDKSVSL